MGSTGRGQDTPVSQQIWFEASFMAARGQGCLTGGKGRGRQGLGRKGRREAVGSRAEQKKGDVRENNESWGGREPIRAAREGGREARKGGKRGRGHGSERRLNFASQMWVIVF